MLMGIILSPEEILIRSTKSLVPMVVSSGDWEARCPISTSMVLTSHPSTMQGL